MESDNRKICRLCLETCNDNFEAVKKIHQENLKLILLNLDLAVTYQPIICTYCGETLQKCSNFRMACLIVDNSVVSFAERQDSSEVDLRKFYRLALPSGSNVCRFCLKVTKCDFFVYLNEEKLDILLMNAMLQQYFPEMDLNVTKEPIICVQCYNSLQLYFNFVTSCLTVENKIDKYCETEVANLKGLVNLSRVLFFTSQLVLEHKDEPGCLNVTEKKGDWYEGESKTEGMWFEEGDSKIFEIKNEKITDEEEYHEEIVNSCENKDVKFENIMKGNELLEEIEGTSVEVSIKNENITDVEENHCEGLEHTNVNSDIKKGDNQTNKQEFNENCNNTEKITDDSFRASTNLLQLTEDLQEVTSITENTGNCISKLITDNLEMCKFNSKESSHDSSEVEMYNCTKCSFNAKHKYCYKKHLLTHQKASEIKMHKCEMCTYQNKRKQNLKIHMLNHRGSSEVTMHKCELCSYQSRYKIFALKHMVAHESIAEGKVFKCAICECQFKYKAYLQMHMLGHKNISEIKMYKCEHCPYQSNDRDYFKQHLLVHKSFSEITVYKCRICTYQSKRNAPFQRHMLNHRPVSEVTMLKCEVCPYQTRHKGNLQRHMLTHENISKVKAFLCEICGCRVESKIGLQRHILKHKNKKNV